MVMCLEHRDSDMMNFHKHIKDCLDKGIRPKPEVGGVNQRSVYADASVENPKTSWWSIGSIGVVHVGRDLTKEPLNNIEEEIYTYVDQEWDEEQGWLAKLGCGVTGVKLSSTRAELVGAIMAILVPWNV